jgi:hypothetical protein
MQEEQCTSHRTLQVTTLLQGFMTTSFEEDKKRGKIGERIFKEDFLDFLGITYEDVTGCQQFQVIDTDYLTKIGTYEVKANYKDNKMLVFEDWSNVNKSHGWIYKTQADLLVFVSKKTRTMIFLPFTDRFKKHYKYIRENTKLIKNRPTRDANGNQWVSAYRKVPFDMLAGYISVYKVKPDVDQSVARPNFFQ